MSAPTYAFLLACIAFAAVAIVLIATLLPYVQQLSAFGRVLA